MEYLRVRNFERFQHYHDRRPPWIKLYNSLWSDPRFFELSESDRYFLISFFIVASQNDNKIPANANWLKREFATRKTPPIELLISTGWLEWAVDDASKMLAKSVHDDSIALALARSRETESEKEIQTPVVPVNGNGNGHSNGTYSDDFAAFWAVYPKHVGKGAAYRSWRKIHPSQVLRDTILLAVSSQKRCTQWTREGGRYIPNPETWLNQSRWDDDVQTVAVKEARLVL